MAESVITTGGLPSPHEHTPSSSTRLRESSRSFRSALLHIPAAKCAVNLYLQGRDNKPPGESVDNDDCAPKLQHPCDPQCRVRGGRSQTHEWTFRKKNYSIVYLLSERAEHWIYEQLQTNLELFSDSLKT